MRRLFAALDPPPDVVADLDRALRRKSAALRWVPPDQWHVTLAFYGDVAAVDEEDLRERLARAAGRTTPISLQLNSGGCFPRRPDSARVLWAGVAGDLAELGRLADRCVAAGRRSGIEMERRRFQGHLTLARARVPTDMSGRLGELWAYAGPAWVATTLRLVHSTLGAEVRHETVAEWPLGERIFHS